MQFLPGTPIDYLMSQNFADNYLNSLAEDKKITNVRQQQIIEENFLDQSYSRKLLAILKNYSTFQFGKSIKYNKKVSSLLQERIINSFAIGAISTFFLYIIGIYCGYFYCTTESNLLKNILDCITVIGYAIPNLILSIILIIIFSSGNYFFSIFPIQNLHSIHWSSMNCWEKIKDYSLHIFLPILTIILGHVNYYFNYIKNRIIHEQSKPYYQMAISKGLSKAQAIRNHILKNSSITLIAALPSHLNYIIFSGTLFFIEIAFSINGLGMLGYEAILSRDYPLIAGVIFTYSVALSIGLMLNDILHMLCDTRVNH